MATRRILGSAEPVSNGKVIFAYRHIGTNQVLYSLRQSMKPKDVLKQLPYAGRHSVPTALRKDLWTPFFTVTFMSPAQGLDAYQKLREMRKLRQFCWKKNPNAEAIRDAARLPVTTELAGSVPSAPTTPTSAAETTAAETTPAKTTGAAKTTSTPTPTSTPAAKPPLVPASPATSFFAKLKPSQLSARQFVFGEMLRDKLGHAVSGIPARKLIREYLLDHKATSVADLAAILQIQARKIDERTEKASAILKATAGRANVYETQGRALARQTTPSVLNELTDRITSLKAARSGLVNSKDPADIEQAGKLKTELKQLIAQRFKSSRALELFGPDGKRSLTDDERIDISTGRFQPIARKHRAGLIPLPSAGTARNYLLGGKIPAPFSIDGVHVQWAELYDADFAAEWPAEVIHSAMSPYIRHTAPNPLSPPPPSFSAFVQSQRTAFGVAVNPVTESSKKQTSTFDKIKSWLPGKRPTVVSDARS